MPCLQAPTRTRATEARIERVILGLGDLRLSRPAAAAGIFVAHRGRLPDVFGLLPPPPPSPRVKTFFVRTNDGCM